MKLRNETLRFAALAVAARLCLATLGGAQVPERPGQRSYGVLGCSRSGSAGEAHVALEFLSFAGALC